MKLPQRPIPSMPAVAQPRGDQPRFSAMGVGQALYRGKIALEIAAGDAEAWRKIGIGTDAAVELQRRSDFRPVAADSFAQFRQCVADRDRGNETAIDRDLRQFRAFVAHGQDWAAECIEHGAEAWIERS